MKTLNSLAAALLTAVATLGMSAAHAGAGAPELTVINQYRQAFLTQGNQQNTNIGNHARQLDEVAQNPGSACMTAMQTAKDNAAEAHVARALPPDPTTFIRDNSCLLEVAQQPIRVGEPWIDMILAWIMDELVNGICEETQDWFGNLTQMARTGRYDVLAQQNAQNIIGQIAQGNQAGAQMARARATPQYSARAPIQSGGAVMQQQPQQQQPSLFGLLLNAIGG